MKTVTTLITACAILMACEATDPVRSPTRPVAAAPIYVLSGLVSDEAGHPLAGAKVEIVARNVVLRERSTTTNENGVFSFVGVWGEIQVQIQKPGFYTEVQTLVVSADIRVDVRLVTEILQNAVPSDSIQLGNTIRAITNEPPCDPTNWDAQAPCRRFDFAPTVPGRLVVSIWYVGSEIDATLVTGFVGVYLDTSRKVGPGEIRLDADLEGYRRYEVRVNSYYEQQEFNLRAEFFPSGR